LGLQTITSFPIQKVLFTGRVSARKKLVGGLKKNKETKQSGNITPDEFKSTLKCIFLLLNLSALKFPKKSNSPCQIHAGGKSSCPPPLPLYETLMWRNHIFP
jgi:hypothetical protein